MSSHPYMSLPDTRFWSSGVKSPVNAHDLLAIEPLLDSIAVSDTVASGGSCFAQYVGKELASRNFDYLRSSLSGDRIESFGLGNIYTIAQLKQWLEFCLGRREWSSDCAVEERNQWVDMLLPHRAAVASKTDLIEHRIAIKNEIVNHLKNANVFVFTIGLTETWRNSNDDIYPSCPGALIGEFNEAIHRFHNSTFEEIHADLLAVESLLAEINSTIKIVYTVSPVPLTATASDCHVLLATTYSKSVIRAALGQYCHHSRCASYFPSYELINHHTEADWRFNDNLRSISESGVRYVMRHAFGEDRSVSDSITHAKSIQKSDAREEAICEEELLESYSNLKKSASRESEILIIGDSHMGKLVNGFKAAGVDVVGGMVMNGSGFSDQKFDSSDESIFIPKESPESQAIWSDLVEKLKSLNGSCQIITNVGFQTHRTINHISNHIRSPVLTEQNISEYFEKNFGAQVRILSELTKLGKVWMVEDPNFYAFIAGKDTAMTIRDKNFHRYCEQMRKIARDLDIEYLSPCDTALQNLFKDSRSLGDIMAADGYHGSQLYYDYCATVVNESLAEDVST